jgi:hypothetical protein
MQYPFSIPSQIAKEPIQTIFSRDYILANKGLYVKEPNKLPFNQEGDITLEELFEVLQINEFCKFFTIVLNKKQAQWFALDCAKFAWPYFEKVYPNIHSVRKCIEANEQYLLGNIDIEVLSSAIKAVRLRDAAYYAAYAAYAAFAAYAAYAADDAAYAAADATQDDFKPFVKNWLKNLLNHQKN